MRCYVCFLVKHGGELKELNLSPGSSVREDSVGEPDAVPFSAPDSSSRTICEVRPLARWTGCGLERPHQWPCVSGVVIVGGWVGERRRS